MSRRDLNNALLFFFPEYTMNEDRKKLPVTEIEAHFKRLSEEYGFEVHPKAGIKNKPWLYQGKGGAFFNACSTRSGVKGMVKSLAPVAS